MKMNRDYITMSHNKEYIENHYRDALERFNNYCAVLCGLTAKRSSTPIDNVLFEHESSNVVFRHAYFNGGRDPAAYIHQYLSGQDSHSVGIFTDLALYVDQMFLNFTDGNMFNTINITFDNCCNLVFEVLNIKRRSIANGSERMDRIHRGHEPVHGMPAISLL